MKFLVQRVSDASVTVDNELVGKIGRGFLVLIGIEDADTEELADKMVKKLIDLRIFEDSEGKTNLNIETVDGELLMISQFTLYADCRKGNRPSFVKAGKPDMANDLYEYIIKKAKERVKVVEKGVFGGDMKVSLLNDGPFTVMLDSHEIFDRK
ncbi:D-aminoacyl-tRNA deacylase [Lachnospiraceae bacterium C1.1]|nr:D-aminoacyl-tRNA deacylase [Lachnospiraceae bacterium C1.1]